jgi:prefoldin subunit 4
LSTELELADEDEKIQYAKFCPALRQPTPNANNRISLHRYKIGDAFFHVPLEQAQEMLEVAATTIDEETSQLEDKISSVREEMQLLKVDLYARFGKQINLEV